MAAQMVYEYVCGFQGDVLGPSSVACMTKHFPGDGPQKDGMDPHFSDGKEQVYPGNNFEYHLIPFGAAFRAGTAMIMPYYGQPIGLPVEEVGFGFNKDVITGLLRNRYGFDGVVCTDWGLLTSIEVNGAVIFPARANSAAVILPVIRSSTTGALQSAVNSRLAFVIADTSFSHYPRRPVFPRRTGCERWRNWA